MIETWYFLLSFMLFVYVVLDGRNFGAGIIHWHVAKTPEERRQVIAAIGPLWSWHEVWLVGFGGTLFAVFPRLLASGFAGYYLALFLILWCLIFRGVSLEVEGASSTTGCGRVFGILFSSWGAPFSPSSLGWRRAI